MERPGRQIDGRGGGAQSSYYDARERGSWSGLDFKRAATKHNSPSHPIALPFHIPPHPCTEATEVHLESAFQESGNPVSMPYLQTVLFNLELSPTSTLHCTISVTQNIRT